MWRIWMLAMLTGLLGTAAVADGVQAIIINGRSMVPLRAVGEVFGASVNYNSRTKGVDIALDYRKVDMTVGSPRARVDNRDVLLDDRVVVIGGVTYVPARFVSETFGFGISYERVSSQVIIIHPKTKKQMVLVCKPVPPGLAKKGGLPPGLAKRDNVPAARANDDGDRGHGKGHGKKR